METNSKEPVFRSKKQAELAEKNRRIQFAAEQRVWEAAEAAAASRYNIQERNEDAE